MTNFGKVVLSQVTTEPTITAIWVEHYTAGAGGWRFDDMDPQGSWDGDKWVAELGGTYNIHLTPITHPGGWEADYRPLKVRVTFDSVATATLSVGTYSAPSDYALDPTVVTSTQELSLGSPWPDTAWSDDIYTLKIYSDAPFNLLNCEFYETLVPTWVDKTHTSNWTNVVGATWVGISEDWNVPAGGGDISFEPDGGWEVGYRPLAIRLTFTNAEAKYLIVYDTDFATLGQDAAYATGVEMPLTFLTKDIENFTWMVTGAHTITKIEFLQTDQRDQP